MSKHHIKTLAEQIASKGHGSAPFHKEPYQASESIMSGNSQMRGANGSLVQDLAYKIYQEKGGSALDNWLQAERILRNNDQSDLIL